MALDTNVRVHWPLVSTSRCMDCRTPIAEVAVKNSRPVRLDLAKTPNGTHRVITASRRVVAELAGNSDQGARYQLHDETCANRATAPTPPAPREEPDPMSDERHECPQPGCIRAFDTDHGLSVHLARKHNIRHAGEKHPGAHATNDLELDPPARAPSPHELVSVTLGGGTLTVSFDGDAFGLDPDEYQLIRVVIDAIATHQGAQS